MARLTAQQAPRARGRVADRDEWSRTVSLAVIAVILVLAASALMARLLVPMILALVLAITLRPLAHRLERLGLNRAMSSIACTLLVAAVLVGAAGLVALQAGSVIRNSDSYLTRLGDLAAQITTPIEHSKFAEILSSGGGRSDDDPDVSAEDPAAGDASDVPGPAVDADPASMDSATDDAARDDAGQVGDDDGGGDAVPGVDLSSREYWVGKIRENAGSIGSWIFRGVGGVLGVLAQVVVFLFLILYILLTRADWSDRIVRVAKLTGMELEPDDLSRMGDAIKGWLTCVLMVAAGYAVVIALVCWAFRLPQAPLWGIMTGMLILVPYFGALIAGIMLMTVSAVAAPWWWAPIAMLAVYILLQTLESYVILPMLYGRAIHVDPLAVLIGVLFFGFIWGPLGFVAALPTLVLLRGFAEVIPGAEPVQELLGEEGDG